MCLGLKLAEVFNCGMELGMKLSARALTQTPQGGAGEDRAGRSVVACLACAGP